MVANALNESSAITSIRDLQYAIMDTARTQTMPATAGQPATKLPASWVKVLSAVKPTGAFDKETRAAYTEIARTLTIGPAIQQYQQMLRDQLGPNFKTALVTEAQNQVWSAFLDKAVAKRNGLLSIATLPALAQTFAAGAASYKKLAPADKRQADAVKAQNLVLNDAVKKSSAIVSILDLQEALLQMAADKKIASSGVTLTAVSNTATKNGLFNVSSLIFPEGYSVPDTMWAAYLKRVGIRVVSPSNVVVEWANANYIALPPALADVVSSNAGTYVASHGVSPLESQIAPLPLSNQTLRLRFDRPSWVLAKAPSAAQAAATPATQYIQGPPGAAGAAGATGATGATGAPGAPDTTVPAPANADASLTPAASDTSLPGTLPSDTTPATTPAVPPPDTAPAQAGMGGMAWLLFGGLAGGAYLMFAGDKNKQGNKKSGAGRKPYRKAARMR